MRLSGFEAKTVRAVTTVEMKTAEPTRALMERSSFSVSWSPELDPDWAAAIAEKTSGAPFPKARRVTPASDSDSLNFMTIYSSEGDKYSSAVEARLYIRTYIRKAPTGTIAIFIPVSPNQSLNAQ